MLLRIVTWNNCSLMWRAGPRYCWTSVPSLVEELRALNKRTAVKSAARGLHVLITSAKPLAELTPTRPRLFMRNSSFVGV